MFRLSFTQLQPPFERKGPPIRPSCRHTFVEWIRPSSLIVSSLRLPRPPSPASSQTNILHSLTSGYSLLLFIMRQNCWMDSRYARANPYTLNNAQLTDVMSFISPFNVCFGITSVIAIEDVMGIPNLIPAMLWVISFCTASMELAMQGLTRLCTVVGYPYIRSI